MKRVLLVQDRIPYYRVPVYNELAKRVDLTVLYTNGEVAKDIEFSVLKVPTFRIAKRYSLYKKSLYMLAKDFDVVIVPFIMSFLPYKLLPKLPRKYKVIYWSIGVAAGYDTPYDSSNAVHEMFMKYINCPDACLFYSSYPVEKYAKLGIDASKLFVANNTVEVFAPAEPAEKKHILFIGSLYKQKKIYELLESYKAAYDEQRGIPDLIIIGDGEESNAIKEWTTGNKLTEKITLTGEITDEHVLSDYFNAALACISPGQAGLSVLKSMGYGVPFVTMRGAITGGEIFNIENGVNGLILDDYSEIKDLILDTAVNKEKYVQMGSCAREYYEKKRQVRMMADGFEQAINFAYGEEQ